MFSVFKKALSRVFGHTEPESRKKDLAWEYLKRRHAVNDNYPDWLVNRAPRNTFIQRKHIAPYRRYAYGTPRRVSSSDAVPIYIVYKLERPLRAIYTHDYLESKGNFDHLVDLEATVAGHKVDIGPVGRDYVTKLPMSTGRRTYLVTRQNLTEDLVCTEDIKPVPAPTDESFRAKRTPVRPSTRDYATPSSRAS